MLTKASVKNANIVKTKTNKTIDSNYLLTEFEFTN